MKTLGIVLLVLLALFFGSCAVTALMFTSTAGQGLLVIAFVAVALMVACIAGIRALNRSKTPEAPAPAPPAEDSGPSA